MVVGGIDPKWKKDDMAYAARQGIMHEDVR